MLLKNLFLQSGCVTKVKKLAYSGCGQCVTWIASPMQPDKGEGRGGYPDMVKGG